MGKRRVSDVSRIRVKYKPVAYCEGTRMSGGHQECKMRWSIGGSMFSTYTPLQIRAEARGHAFDHPGHHVYVDVVDRESFTYEPE
jgi:hypothetical protein